MTCCSASNLVTHIRFRHLDSKPFKCNFCKYTAKRKYDMEKHLKIHYPGPFYRCEEQGCRFSCRSANVFRRHRDRSHLGTDEAMYCCHICDNRYQRGSLLTRHLLSKHKLCRPSGHSRFHYKRDEYGYFRLQTERYETLDVAQDVKESESCTIQSLCGSSQTLINDEGDSLKREAAEGGVLITIVELDESGHVVSSKDINTDEVSVLPPGYITIFQG